MDESLPCLGQLIVFDIEVGIDRVSGKVSLYQGRGTLEAGRTYDETGLRSNRRSHADRASGSWEGMVRRTAPRPGDRIRDREEVQHDHGLMASWIDDRGEGRRER